MNELKPIYCFVLKEKDKPLDFTCFQLQIDQNLNCEVLVIASKRENARVEAWREMGCDEQKGCRQRVAVILSHPALLSLRETVQIPDLHPCHK